jgi:hypothetical protein
MAALFEFFLLDGFQQGFLAGVMVALVFLFVG